MLLMQNWHPLRVGEGEEGEEGGRGGKIKRGGSVSRGDVGVGFG